MRPQVIFFLFIMIISLVFMNYSRINNLLYGKESQLQNGIGMQKESKIVADDYSRALILSALNNTNKDIAKYIDSVTVTTESTVTSICSRYVKESIGCTINNYDADSGKLFNSKIYLTTIVDDFGYSAYKGRCASFNNTLYHEIGHVVYAYNFGGGIYQDEEQYADNYADNYSKDKCNTDVYKELDKRLKEKEDAYNNSLKVLSKWDKYSNVIKSENGIMIVKVCGLYSSPNELNCGIPENLYNEYLMDYNQTSKSVDEYNSVLKEIENYLNSVDGEYSKKFWWNFRCIRFCSEKSESEYGFSLESIGVLPIYNLKLVIDFYNNSGYFYSSSISENSIQVINASDSGILRIKIPFRYINEETWSYANIYILQNNARHQLVSSWRGEVINGIWEQ